MYFIGYKPSNFYVNFSLGELVRNNQSPSALILAKSSSGGGSGGFGGGGMSNSDFGNFNSTQDSSYHIQTSQLNDFNSLDLMKSLQNDIQQKLADSGATIAMFLEINPPSIQIDYNYTDKILGYVQISGNFHGSNHFRLKAKLHEISKNKEKAAIERDDFTYQPTGNYYVVPFKEDNKLAQNFWGKGKAAAEESFQHFQKKLPQDLNAQKELIANLKQIIVYTWRPFPAQLPLHILKEMQEAMYGDYEIPSEYQQFGIVYFLNELALQMYREIGEDFEVWKTVSAEEAKQIALNPSLTAYYIPTNER